MESLYGEGFDVLPVTSLDGAVWYVAYRGWGGGGIGAGVCMLYRLGGCHHGYYFQCGFLNKLRSNIYPV